MSIINYRFYYKNPGRELGSLSRIQSVVVNLQRLQDEMMFSHVNNRPPVMSDFY